MCVVGAVLQPLWFPYCQVGPWLSSLYRCTAVLCPLWPLLALVLKWPIYWGTCCFCPAAWVDLRFRFLSSCVGGITVQVLSPKPSTLPSRRFFLGTGCCGSCVLSGACAGEHMHLVKMADLMPRGGAFQQQTRMPMHHTVFRNTGFPFMWLPLLAWAQLHRWQGDVFRHC